MGITSRFRIGLLSLSTAVLAGTTILPGMSGVASAANTQDQINALDSKNATSRSTVQGLQAQAANYQDAIGKLQSQIDGIQASINENQALQASLQQQITDAQNKIAEQRVFLASDLKAMYVDGTPSTLEVVANSKNMSDFVDKHEYRLTVQNKLQETLHRIAELEKQLQANKAQVDQLLTEQRSQQDRLAAARAEQATLLNYNIEQQSSYNAQIQANGKQITRLRAQQAAANRALASSKVSAKSGGTGTSAPAARPITNPGTGSAVNGGYPSKWSGVAQDSVVDSWGMYNRECVSYTAWKVFQKYGHMPYWGGHGNANQWPASARADGIATGSTPKAGSVAISMAGTYGHAMWVERVNGDGSLWISQYNYDYKGSYSEMAVSASMAKSLTYIYFQ